MEGPEGAAGRTGSVLKGVGYPELVATGEARVRAWGPGECVQEGRAGVRAAEGPPKTRGQTDPQTSLQAPEESPYASRIRVWGLKALLFS